MDNEKITELEQKVETFEARIEELENYIAQKKIQQISFPLDEVSKTIITNI